MPRQMAAVRQVTMPGCECSTAWRPVCAASGCLLDSDGVLTPRSWTASSTGARRSPTRRDCEATHRDLQRQPIALQQSSSQLVPSKLLAEGAALLPD